MCLKNITTVGTFSGSMEARETGESDDNEVRGIEPPSNEGCPRGCSTEEAAAVLKRTL